ncbi:hypothetical protein [Azohydromonas aeria]|uniref:hypothetical protein n=1 Tax=Azohydromonas aeria TaxID=2590212 RepID=UPI0012F71D0D|nr:hypothetical protein [Azohydromonas aeria]
MSTAYTLFSQVFSLHTVLPDALLDGACATAVRELEFCATTSALGLLLAFAAALMLLVPIVVGAVVRDGEMAGIAGLGFASIWVLGRQSRRCAGWQALVHACQPLSRDLDELTSSVAAHAELQELAFLSPGARDYVEGVRARRALRWGDLWVARDLAWQPAEARIGGNTGLALRHAMA